MSGFRLAIVALGAVALGGCNKAADAGNYAGSDQAGTGRYTGIGVYDVGQMWTQIVHPGADNPDPAAATADDDMKIIVVVDTRTGEVRQCGDVSHICTAMNPWTKAINAADEPVKLVKHAADLAREEAERQAEESKKGARK